MSRYKNTKDNRRKVPERWIATPKIGDRIPGTPFVPMKCLLADEFYQNYLCDFHQWSFDKLREVIDDGHVMGLNSFDDIMAIIDLSNTDRYKGYQGEVNVKELVKKVRCDGVDAPTDDNFISFSAEVERIMNRKEFDPENSVILVHCTHGYNRTGFMIVRWLVDRCNEDNLPEDEALERALDTFKQHRPPGILKNSYISALYKLYNVGNKDDLADIAENNMWWMKVPTSCWKYMLPTVQFGMKDIHNTENTFLENFNMDLVPPLRIVNEIRRRIMDICDPSNAANNLRDVELPGSNPVSLDMGNISTLSQYTYKATYKSDGVRYFLVAYDGRSYIVNRKFEVREVHVFLCNSEGRPLDDSIIDGELVIEKDGEQIEHKFLVFDVLLFEGFPLVKNYWDSRMAYSDAGIIKFRNMWRDENNPYLEEDFDVIPKTQYDMKNIKELDKYIKDGNIKHETDGMIFTPVNLEFKHRKCKEMFKYKPPDKNSIDCEVKFYESDDEEQLCFLHVKYYDNELIPVTRIVFDDSDFEKQLYEKMNSGTGEKVIYECILPGTLDELLSERVLPWKPVRERNDKLNSNFYYIYRDIIKSVKDNIQLDDILKYSKNV